MKFKSALLGLTYAISLYAILPYLFVQVNRILGWPVFENNLLRFIGGILIVTGAAFFVYLIFLFNTIGRGTPVPIEPPKKLIIKGPYKYTRNPMYVNHLVVFFGLFLYFGHVALALYPVLAWIGLNVLVGKWEEPQLKKRFGQEYEKYLKKVPRWI